MEAHYYTGTIDDLKKLGYKFHKLYARNYKAYNLGNIWLFVKGGFVVEFNSLEAESKYHFNLIQFILDNKDKSETFWYKMSEHPLLKGYKSPNFIMYQGEFYTEKEGLQKFGRDEWCFASKKMPVFFELVQQILALNEKGPFKIKSI